MTNINKYKDMMITQFKNYLFEDSSFKTAKDFLIEVINKKGFVKMKRTREKYIDQINRLNEFVEDNQTIEKKELTQIKNGLDKLCATYFNEDLNNGKEELFKNLGIQSYEYNGPFGFFHLYGLKDAKRYQDKFDSSELKPEEKEFIEKYFKGLEYWVDLHNRIEEIRRILNPTAKERKIKELKEIKGRLNPKIKKAIDEIAENFRQVIENNELVGYERSLEQFREEHGDSVSYKETTNIVNRRRFRWGGVNNKLYKKPIDTPKYSYDYDLVLMSEYQEKMEEIANLLSYEIISKFQRKMYDKIGGMLTDIDKKFEVEVQGRGWSSNDIFFTFEDGSKFSVRNKIVSNVNQHQTFYYTYPTTFHDAFLPNGEKINAPNEYNVKKAFNEFYDNTI